MLETHIHNDYVTAGLELSRTVGADYVGPQATTSGSSGSITLQAMHTPGHTQHHVSYVLCGADARVRGVFTGGSMLHGTTGRTDLEGEEHTDELTRAQYYSAPIGRVA